MIEANSFLGIIIIFLYPMLGKIITDVPSILIALLIYDKIKKRWETLKKIVFSEARMKKVVPASENIKFNYWDLISLSITIMA